MQGELCPLHVSQTLKKKMDKKVYFDPEMEVVELNLTQAILTGSDGNEIPQGGGENEDTPGGW